MDRQSSLKLQKFKKPSDRSLWEQLMKTEYMSSEESDVDGEEDILRVPWWKPSVKRMFATSRFWVSKEEDTPIKASDEKKCNGWGFYQAQACVHSKVGCYWPNCKRRSEQYIVLSWILYETWNVHYYDLHVTTSSSSETVHTISPWCMYYSSPTLSPGYTLLQSIPCLLVAQSLPYPLVVVHTMSPVCMCYYSTYYRTQLHLLLLYISCHLLSKFEGSCTGNFALPWYKKFARSGQISCCRFLPQHLPYMWEIFYLNFSNPGPRNITFLPVYSVLVIETLQKHFHIKATAVALEATCITGFNDKSIRYFNKEFMENEDERRAKGFASNIDCKHLCGCGNMQSTKVVLTRLHNYSANGWSIAFCHQVPCLLSSLDPFLLLQQHGGFIVALQTWTATKGQMLLITASMMKQLYDTLLPPPPPSDEMATGPSPDAEF